MEKVASVQSLALQRQHMKLRQASGEPRIRKATSGSDFSAPQPKMLLLLYAGLKSLLLLLHMLLQILWPLPPLRPETRPTYHTCVGSPEALLRMYQGEDKALPDEDLPLNMLSLRKVPRSSSGLIYGPMFCIGHPKSHPQPCV